MNDCGKRRRIGTGKLQTALQKVLYDKKEKIAFITANEQISYENVVKKIEVQCEEYNIQNINKIAICMSNSIEFCIQLLTAILYMDEVYIFSSLWESSLVVQICQENNVQVLVSEEGKKIFANHDSMREHNGDVKFILFTSGTTHLPKGVVLTGENIYLNALAAIKCMSYVETDKILVTKPLYHSYGLTIEFIAGILVGAEFYLDRGLFNVNKVSKIIMKHEITVWCTIPTLLCIFIDKKVLEFSTLRIIAVGGARSVEKLLKNARAFWAPTPVIQMYGLTEAGPLVTCTPNDLPEEKINSIGKPVEGVKLEIRDRKDNLITTPNVSGELVVSSQSVMTEYLNNGSATKKVKKKGRLYTGDIGYFDEDNFFYIEDRIDTMIVHDGVNIFCAEIENALMAHNKIEQAFVAGIEDILHSQIAVAYIKAIENIDKKEIILWCKTKAVSVPDEIIFVDNLPYNDNGKVSISNLKTMYSEYKKGVGNG